MLKMRLLIVVPVLLGLVWQILLRAELDGVSFFGMYISANNSGAGSYVRTKKGNALKEGFCSLTMDEVSQNTEGITGLLNNITSHPYFRYFKVNLDRECRYWVAEASCTCDSNGCQICTCDDSGIPETLKYPYDMSDVSAVERRTAPDKHAAKGFEDEIKPIDPDRDATYVDLLQNPEANTGYSGPKAARVWQAVYDNCNIDGLPSNDTAGVENREKALLRQLLSGLHTSITMHVAAFFYNDTKGDSPLRSLGVLNNPNISFYPNCGMFRRIVKNDEFIRNLFVVYQFVLRAVAKTKRAFLANSSLYNSGFNGAATDGDVRLYSNIGELFSSKLFRVATFDEQKFFESPGAHLLVRQMKRVVHNVTTLMDCVTCEKCRAWGKLETAALATALKIVFGSAENVVELNRGERVALINFARQLAISVKNVRSLAAVCEKFNYTAMS
ncbi:endoplasmic reticulum oxidoreductin, putative [Trypanosoma brucei gambiense DAL972]|uniref:Endoplasmic reticulum oxidoreductin, putative n=3 Tax=Trypanosoma brucei TaxID=5691 RepID=C9ZVU0_TRYB9|nr:endoplasmic reticulum oxidoreductin, putative [Trypanosoma brucei gambiense DAL972]RHW71045.1 endoplasmic reticulum oxidoreductin [Trypanosoma brucei equiperdum]CAA43286.1 pol associated gene 1 [Trypanosoma brucei]CBH13528.1 endoplasmic reticulum oxidoreductin, putative [Trypanosoma brucei gambiense DAL972]|eukprot:XP_011775805.1 endoplasmic reticulum oxidoreductin, putative [Trypanosoma brucei gambiense DAL972]